MAVARLPLSIEQRKFASLSLGLVALHRSYCFQESNYFRMKIERKGAGYGATFW